jgi:four helix bundle protein
MKQQNPLKDKSFLFAVRIVKCCKYLRSSKKETVLSKQLLRSGTSIGANIREAEQAQSKADFIHKLSISLKETNETLYWLELLVHSDYLATNEFESIHKDCIEIIKLLTSIIKKSKTNIGSQQPK